MSVMLSSIFPSTFKGVSIVLVVWKSTEFVSHGIGIEYLDNPKMKVLQ